jgi:hypothetical protein
MHRASRHKREEKRQTAREDNKITESRESKTRMATSTKVKRERERERDVQR